MAGAVSRQAKSMTWRQAGGIARMGSTTSGKSARPPNARRWMLTASPFLLVAG